MKKINRIIQLTALWAMAALALTACSVDDADSYNDLEMIRASKAGFLFRSTEQIKKDNPDLPAFEEYDEFLAAIEGALV